MMRKFSMFMAFIVGIVFSNFMFMDRPIFESDTQTSLETIIILCGFFISIIFGTIIVAEALYDFKTAIKK